MAATKSKSPPRPRRITGKEDDFMADEAYLVSNNLQTNVVATGRLAFRAESDLPSAARHFAMNAAQQEQMVRLLKAWDLGLSGVQLRELSGQSPDGEVTKFWFPFGVHTDRAGAKRELSFMDESSGT